jgi:hypothetical protein
MYRHDSIRYNFLQHEQLRREVLPSETFPPYSHPREHPVVKLDLLGVDLGEGFQTVFVVGEEFDS